MKSFLTACIFILTLYSTALRAQSVAVDSLSGLIEKETDDHRRATLLNQLSFAYHTVDFKKAEESAIQAYKIATRIQDESNAAESLMMRGLALYYQGKYEQVADFYYQSLTRYEALGDRRGMSGVLNELGTFHKRQGDNEKALDNFQQSLTHSTSIHDSTLIANAMNNIGIVYQIREDYILAMDYFQRSAVIKEKLNDLNGLTYNYDNMGTVLASMGRFDEARGFMNKVIDIRAQLGDRAGTAIAFNNMGEIFMMEKHYAEAREQFLLALDITFTIGYKDLRRHIYNMLSEAYRADNDFEKAYSYYVKSAQLKDSIYNEQKSNQILDLQTKYETEKKESQITLLRQENDIKDFKLERNRLFSIILMIMVVALIGLAVLWRKQVLLRQKAELEKTRTSLKEGQLRAVIASQEEERKRFAADLHDGMGQMISAVRLNLSNENVSKHSIDQAVTVLNDMNGEIRNIAFNLMPQVLMSSGLDTALIEFANRINRTGKITVTVQAFGMGEALGVQTKIALYRVCQEWVNNVIKYSGCTTISIQLVRHEDELVITIEDNGKGFDPKKLTTGHGNGWKNINSRLDMIKASIDIDSQPQRQGTTAIITVPG